MKSADGGEQVAIPTFRAAVRFWLKLGWISFGGPAGQIAIMQTELVERRRWIDQARFLHALNSCMLLPGPEAQQLAIYLGWLLHGTAGGVIAGALFVLPSMLILWALSAIYAAYGNLPWIAAIFYGLKPAVMAIVAVAVIRIGRKALRNSLLCGLAAASFVAIYFFHVAFPLIILAALLIGFCGGIFSPEKFSDRNEIEPAAERRIDGPKLVRPSWPRALRISTTCLLLWWLPILSLGAWSRGRSTLFQEGVFFSKAAVITFGGAYAVLPYVAQQAVSTYGWLHAGQMMDGLGLAETTPGPLIMVLQFVGFMGGWNQPGPWPRLLAATFGALITTWVTFVPCFLWIFLGAPHVEQLRSNQKLTAALAAVTAAVVGVVLNLAVWFGWHVLLPAEGRFDWSSLVLAVIAFVGMMQWSWKVAPVILGSGVAGLLLRMVF